MEDHVQPTSPLGAQRKWLRRLLRTTVALCFLVCILCGYFYWRLHSSLPQLTGKIAAPTIKAEVQVARDGQGVPSIEGQSRVDIAFALGFVHAQDRYFQMDLLRRMSGGRLAELAGPSALPSDRRFRRHRFQSLAEKVCQNLPADKRAVLSAYTAGVNHGLSSLKDYPFEYLVLNQSPALWQETDSILVMMTMLCDLQPMDGRGEIGLGVLKEKVAPEVFNFLVRSGSHWDAALDGSEFPMPQVPPAEVFTLRDNASFSNDNLYALQTEKTPWASSVVNDPDFMVGSNNWAVGNGVGRDSRAILASDMHLGLNVPTIWYRAFMKGPCLNGQQRSLVGVTLPGTPVLIEGSNGKVAWGFTNSYGDYGDIVELKRPDPTKSQYVTSSGIEELQTFEEELLYPGGKEVLSYRWSKWGPVVEERDQRLFVHCWIGNDPKAFDLNLIDFEIANTTQEAMAIANRSGMPNQNVTVADDQGNIGWTLSGRIPKRPGPPSLVPVDWSQGVGEWQGYLTPEEYPRLYNPEDGRIWTANNRIMGTDYLNKVGDGRFDPGARARQIRDRLYEKDQFTEDDLLAVQLDDEARFMKVWKERLLETSAVNPNKLSSEFIQHVEKSSDRASVDAVGYRIISEFRLQTLSRIFGIEAGRSSITAPTKIKGLARKLGITQNFAISRDAVADQLLKERPMHWLPSEYSSWDELLLDAAQAAQVRLSESGPLTDATWGKRNRARIKHPLSQAVSALSFILDMHPHELPGDSHMPRVQSPSGGASQRMVVSPGEEEKGYYHQPGGQSGHPLSRFYSAGYEDWVYGNKSPLLPGPSEYQLKLVPLN